MYSALVGAEVTLATGHSLDVKLDAGHEPVEAGGVPGRCLPYL